MCYVIGTIYKIYYKLDPTIQYVGSTYSSLIDRWKNHKDCYKRYLRGDHSEVTIYPYFTELGGTLQGISDNFEIEKIKDYIVYRDDEDERDRKHLNAYEQLWINKLKCVNKYAAFNPLRYNKRYLKIEKAINARRRNENLTEKQKEARLKSYRKYDAKPERRAKKLADAKNRKKRCEICDIEMRSDGYDAHLKTKRHLKNLEKYNKNDSLEVVIFEEAASP